MLVGVVAHLVNPKLVDQSVITFYLFSYILMTVGGFAILSSCAVDGKELTQLDDLRGMYKRAPLITASLVLILLGLMGTPPTGGFIAKVNIFIGAIKAEQYLLAVVLGVTSVISLYYYIGILKAVLVNEDTKTQRMAIPKFGVTLSAVICAVGSLLAALILSPRFIQFLSGSN